MSGLIKMWWLDQCQDDTKKNIPLENMANQYIRYLDAKSNMWRKKKSRRRETVYLFLKTMYEE